MRGREVLPQGAEVGVVATIPHRLRALRDRLHARVIVAAHSELVEELADGVVEALTVTNASRHSGERLGQSRRRWRM